jgi:hypothetical protein
MFGPVTINMRRLASRRQSLGMKAGAAGFHQAGFDHRVAALFDLDAGMVDELGPRPAQVAARSANAARASKDDNARANWPST